MRRGCKYTLMVLGAVWLLVSCALAVIYGDNTGSGSPTRTLRPTRTSTPAPRILDIGPQDIHDNLLPMTSVQKSEYLRSLTGNIIFWACPVHDADLPARITLRCRISTRSNITYVDVVYDVSPDTPIARYQRGQVMTVRGRIRELRIIPSEARIRVLLADAEERQD